MTELMPYAKAVSAKSYDFDTKGEESTIDFKRIIDITKEFNYDGYYGIEYEGLNLGENDGIIKQKSCLKIFIIYCYFDTYHFPFLRSTSLLFFYYIIYNLNSLIDIFLKSSEPLFLSFVLFYEYYI